MAIDPGIALLCLGLPALAAYAVMRVHHIPRDRERLLNARLRAAFRKSNVEVAGLRKSLEGAELRMRDVRAATAGIDENLRFKIQRMPARDQAALDSMIGQGTFTGLLSLLRHGVIVDRRLASLQRRWSRGVSVRESVRALCENLWVLEPDLKTEGHIFAGKTLGAVTDAYFGVAVPSDDLAVMAARKKPSAVGMFRRRSAIANANDQGDRTLIIIEARRPGETVGQAVVSAAVGYAHAMRKLVPELSHWPVECLVVGGAFTEDAEFAASHAPPGTPVHLTTWEALLNRARSRRPETVELSEVRFDADQPPAFDLNVRSAAMGTFLDLETGDGETSDAEPGAVQDTAS